MKYPLRNIVFEKMKASDNMTDKELLTTLQRDGEDVSMRDINKGTDAARDPGPDHNQVADQGHETY